MFLFLHRRRTGNRAEIVVDAHTCLSMWYDGLNWSIGMEAQQLIERLRSFVARFENIDADLVFFIRGLMEKRRRTWLGRTAEEFRKKKRIFEMLNGGRSFGDITNNSYSKENYIPPNMTIFVAYVLKHVLNCKVCVTFSANLNTSYPQYLSTKRNTYIKFGVVQLC